MEHLLKVWRKVWMKVWMKHLLKVWKNLHKRA
jgi:hypothetical protein